MKGTCYVLLKLLLLGVCLAHVGIGLGLNVSPEFPKMLALWYGATQVAWPPQFLYILRPIGVYMVVMGLLAAVAFGDSWDRTSLSFAVAKRTFLVTRQQVLSQKMASGR